MSQTECPKCHALHSRRLKQEGFFQKAILQHLGYFPWQCRFCKAIFKLKKRGHRTADNRLDAGDSERRSSASSSSVAVD